MSRRWVGCLGILLLFSFMILMGRAAYCSVGRYTLQLTAVKGGDGLVALRGQGKKLAAELGVPVYLVKKDGGFYALMVGRFNEKKQAEVMRHRLSARYPKAFVSPWNPSLVTVVEVYRTFAQSSVPPSGVSKGTPEKESVVSQQKPTQKKGFVPKKVVSKKGGTVAGKGVPKAVKPESKTAIKGKKAGSSAVTGKKAENIKKSGVTKKMGSAIKSHEVSYALQVDAITKKSGLPSLRHDGWVLAKQLNIPTFLVKKGSFYALVIGKFSGKKKAMSLRKQLISTYPQAFVVSWKKLQLMEAYVGGTKHKAKKARVSSKTKTLSKARSKAKTQKGSGKISKGKPMRPQNTLRKISVSDGNLVLEGARLWDFVDTEKLKNPLRYVVHLFNTRPSMAVDTLYAPISGVEKIKMLYDYKNKKTDVVFYPSRETSLAVMKDGKYVVVSLKAPERVVRKTKERKGEEKAIGGEGAKKVYKGKKISLEFKDEDIRDVVRLISEVSGRNFVIDPDVKGTVTVKLDDVPWDQALDIILKTNKLGKVEEYGIIRVATLRSLAAQGSAQERARKALEKTQPTVLEVIPLNYTEASKVESLIKPLLSDDGKVDYLERTNSLVIKDNPDRIKKVRQFIKRVDTPTPQIQIGARMVDIVTTYLKELGIQWGFLWRQTKTGMSFPYSFGVGGGVSTAPAAAQSLTTMKAGAGWSPDSLVPGFVVDLPAAAMTGSGGAIAASLLNASETFGLDMRLSALEEEGVARTVSNPKLVTLDNQEAEISQGYEIPFATVSESGTQTEFKEAKLKLTVKPHITSSGDIVMDVEVSKDSPDFTHVTPDGVAIQTRSIKTSVRMKNGDTLVIGGIYEMTKSNTNKEVPGLSRIPLLSWLFRHRTENLEKRELLIFITPTVAEASSTKSVQ